MPKRNKISLPFTLGFYDEETGLLPVRVFSLGKQVITHKQLQSHKKTCGMICASWKIYGEDQITTVYKSEKDIVAEFDKFAKRCQVIIGKNNYSFDDPRMGTERMLAQLPPNIEFYDKSEDLERLLRKYFSLPSYSLDYFSQLIGCGGKDRMEYSDWERIDDMKLLKSFPREIMAKVSPVLFGKPSSVVLKDGSLALAKMIKYNRKDILDTEAMFDKILPYIKLKYNVAASNDGYGCRVCGRKDKLFPTEVTMSGMTKYQNFECRAQGEPHYAGKATWKYKTTGGHVRTYGKMR